MNIGNEKIAVVIFLHFQKATHRAEIISEVQISGWPDAADNYLFGHDFLSKLGSKNTLTNFNSQELIGFDDNHVRWLKPNGKGYFLFNLFFFFVIQKTKNIFVHNFY
jgi:hypothetical protein